MTVARPARGLPGVVQRPRAVPRGMSFPPKAWFFAAGDGLAYGLGIPLYSKTIPDL